MADSDDEKALVDVKMDGDDVEGVEDLKFQDFTKVDDVNNLNTVGKIGDTSSVIAPSNIRTHALEDLSDDDEEDKTEVSWLKLNAIYFVFVHVVGFKSHTVCQNCVHRQVVYIESSFLLDH
ncbi:hypothetical protein P5673_025118 [Acropora cervicornis]|uniref:Uncharacterized protein n=1 Tax=Acropora cervicornis TaxID=6130 RepID=A0AAD9UXH9_ACRCE|nr:hypothetical protein P5673_025118 [Acropora cervicornis]